MANCVDTEHAELRERVNAAEFARLLDIRVLELGPGYAVATMPVDERLDNWMGRTHGGAIMALADQTLSAAAATVTGHPLAIQFNINLLSAGPKGEEVTATARLIHGGRRVAVFAFEVRDRKNRLLAQGQATGLCQ